MASRSHLSFFCKPRIQENFPLFCFLTLHIPAEINTEGGGCRWKYNTLTLTVFVPVQCQVQLQLGFVT